MRKLLLDGLLDLLAPPLCAACRTPLAARSETFCAACGPLVDHLPQTHGTPDDRDACAYGGPLRDALHRLKYEGASELAVPLARLLTPAARAFDGRIDCVTAVPLHPRRLRVRGYNQAALIARPLARALSVPFVPFLLVRVRDTTAQVGRGAAARQAQLEQAFLVRGALRQRSCLVVDDVRTTGATLAEARRALLAGGAAHVCTLALACVLPEEESARLAGL